jgi:hypothetical protein
MKKLILLLALLLCPLSANATYWYEYSYKSYADLDTIKKSANTAFIWAKVLNDGNMKPINNKKVWFAKNSTYVDLKNKKIALKDIYYYDTDGNFIDSVNLDKLYWDVIVPGSMAEDLYKLVKKYPRFEKVTDKELWVDIDEYTKLDVFSLFMTNSQCCNMWIITRKSATSKKYFKAFLSVDLTDSKFAIIELIEYNRKGKVIKIKKFDELNYIVDNDNVLKPIIDYINNLEKDLQQTK